MERLNLKICIENDENSDSDDENAVILSRMSDSEGESDSRESVRSRKSNGSRDSRSYSRSRSNSSSSSGSSSSSYSGSGSSSSGSSGSSSGSSSDSDSENERETVRSETATTATLNVSLDEDHKLLQDPKRYENKAGTFVTGFDPLSEEFRKKRDKRAERFGIKKPTRDEDDFDIKELYDSLGVTEQDLKCSERGIRLEAVHIRGVDEMSTKDVFKYFKDYGAALIEWIDDSSCNVLWEDSVTAARALINLSSRIKDPLKDGRESRMSKHSKKKSTKEKSKHKEKKEQNMEVDEPANKAQDAPEEDDFDYSLNLMSDDEEGKTEPKTSSKGKEETGDGSSEKSSQKSQEDEAMDTDEDDASPPPSPPPIVPPPGRWRHGIPFQGKASQIFLRYATKADKKVAGAEKRSKYYQKYGNPNFGGMRGIISTSRKRRIRAAKNRQDEYLARKMVSKSRRYTEIPEETEFDKHLREALERQRKQKRAQNSNSDLSASEEEEEEEEEESDDSEGGPYLEYSDVEDELRAMMGLETDAEPKLRQPPSKKRYMRMHADDVEEQKEKKRSNQHHFAISVEEKMSDVRHRLVDARALITGRPRVNDDIRPQVTDLRSRLGRKRPSERLREGYRDLTGMPSLTIQVEPD